MIHPALTEVRHPGEVSSTNQQRRLRELPATSPAPGANGASAQRERTGERTYFCRGCLIAQTGRWVPAGWYTLERSVGGGGKSRRLGLYCSVACIIDSEERIKAGEAAHDRLIGVAENPGQRAERLVELARKLLYDGQMTLRQVGDELDVPTSALRQLLQRAGIEIPPTPAPAHRAEKPGADPDKPALMVIHELTQTGRLREVEWSEEGTGPAHAPTFTVRVTAQARTPDGGFRPFTAEASAGAKMAAKASAGAALIVQLRDSAVTP
jgi:hypothetical protein